MYIVKLWHKIFRVKKLRCAWCKNTFPEKFSQKHKENCRYYKPVPTVTGIDKTGYNVKIKSLKKP